MSVINIYTSNNLKISLRIKNVLCCLFAVYNIYDKIIANSLVIIITTDENHFKYLRFQ